MLYYTPQNIYGDFMQKLTHEHLWNDADMERICAR